MLRITQRIFLFLCSLFPAFLKDPELGRLGAAVLFQFLFPGNNRFVVHAFSFRLFPAYAHRKVRRTGAGMFGIAEGVLHDPVFQGMESDHCEPAARIQEIDHLLQRSFQHIQFPVAGDANRLKTAFGRMSVRPHLGRYRALYDLV